MGKTSSSPAARAGGRFSALVSKGPRRAAGTRAARAVQAAAPFFFLPLFIFCDIIYSNKVYLNQEPANIMPNSNHINLNPYTLKLYSSPGGTHQDLSAKVVKLLKTKLSPLVYKSFQNGEFITHHAESVRDRDVYLICQPRFGDKENLSYDLDECESLVFALRQGEPTRISVVMPSLPYS